MGVANGQPATTSITPSLFRSPTATVVGPVVRRRGQGAGIDGRVPNTGASGRRCRRSATRRLHRWERLPTRPDPGLHPNNVEDGLPIFEGSVLVYVSH